MRIYQEWAWIFEICRTADKQNIEIKWFEMIRFFVPHVFQKINSWSLKLKSKSNQSNQSSLNGHFINFESKTSINVIQISKSRPKEENLRWVAWVSYIFFLYMNEKTWIFFCGSIASFWITGVQIDLKSETEIYTRKHSYMTSDFWVGR